MASHRQATPSTKRFARAWPRNPSPKEPKRSPGKRRVRSPPTPHIREPSSDLDAPKTRQDAPGCPQDAPDLPQDTARHAQDGQGEPQITRGAPTQPQEAPKRPLDFPRRAKSASTQPEDGPKTPQDGPQTPQDTPEKLRDCPKAARHAQPPPGNNQERKNISCYTDLKGSFRRSLVLQYFMPHVTETRLTSLVKYDGRFGVAAPLDSLICSDARIRRQW